MRAPVTCDLRRALELLRAGTGQRDAEFRQGQEEAIRHVVEGRGRFLVVQKTGWGKSFVYFIATRLLRDAGAGPALLISPLLSLMRNQIAAAGRMGVRAGTINSSNHDDWQREQERLRCGETDILLIAPERLGNERFRDEVLAEMAERIGLLVIDEAHCISDWGHDFRPHYRRIERIARTLPANLRLLATTATANDRVTRDLAAMLGPAWQCFAATSTGVGDVHPVAAAPGPCPRLRRALGGDAGPAVPSVAVEGRGPRRTEVDGEQRAAGA